MSDFASVQLVREVGVSSEMRIGERLGSVIV